MHLDKAEVVGRIALQFGNVVNTQTGVGHGLAHGDAVSVLLCQPVHVELADQCA